MRAITLSNGNITVNLDQFGRVRDFYYPYVGLENHILGHVHRLGVWIDGNFWWLGESQDWSCSCHFVKETMIGETIYTNRNLGVKISFIDGVDTAKNILIRKVIIKNDNNSDLEVRIFFGQEFLIGEHRLANTAFYDPTDKSIIHYKGDRVFLINVIKENEELGVDDYTIGVWGYGGKEGSFNDACDGVLPKNTVDHGPTDSVIGVVNKILAGDQLTQFHYFVAVGKSIEEVKKLSERVVNNSPERLLEVSINFWRAWVNKRKLDFGDLPESVVSLYKRSLLVVRSHFDNRGAVIASSDSDRLSYGKEGYAFVWPRDGAFAAMAMDNAGYTEVTRPFFEFMNEVITDMGYLRHKYLADKSLGSTWHSSVRQNQWLTENKLQLPIQEDETASVVFALWNHYKKTFDIEMAERMYESFIYPAGQFMMFYKDKKTGLPKESYDLWEEKLGVATFTAASVYGGLIACAKFAGLLGKKQDAENFSQEASNIKQAIVKYLFSKTRNSFIRTVRFVKGELKYNEIIDASSLLGLWFFRVLKTTDPLFIATEKAVKACLFDTCPMGGYIRYEGDEYYRYSDKSNPWFITTLWDIQLDIYKAKSLGELKKAMSKIDWILKHTTESGILAEQIDAYEGQPICVSPLTWSHSTFIDTVVMYLEKVQKLEVKNQK